MTIIEQAKQAYAAGLAAYEARQPATVNPHAGQDERLARAWMQGWFRDVPELIDS